MSLLGWTDGRMDLPMIGSIAKAGDNSWGSRHGADEAAILSLLFPFFLYLLITYFFLKLGLLYVLRAMNLSVELVNRKKRNSSEEEEANDC